MLYRIDTTNVTNPALLVAAMRREPVDVLWHGWCPQTAGLYVVIVTPSDRKKPKKRDCEVSRDVVHSFNNGATVSMRPVTQEEVDLLA